MTGSSKPTRDTVLKAFEEYDGNQDAFLEKYANGGKPKKHFVLHEEEHYPLKAVWAAAHRPSIKTSRTAGEGHGFSPPDAMRGLCKLGFKPWTIDR